MSKNKYVGLVVLLCSLSFLMMGCESEIRSSTQISTKDISQNKKMNHKIASEEREFAGVGIEANDLSVSIEKAEKSGYAIFSKENHDNEEGYFEIEHVESNGKNIIRFRQQQAENQTFHLVIYSAHPEELECDFLGRNTVFVAKESLKKMKLDLKDGIVDLMGEASYPINLNTEAVVTSIQFKEWNATVSVESEGGVLTTFGNKKQLSEGENVLHHQKYGEGRDFIRIDAKNSTVELSD
ncbi:hypothetical protein [Filifactor alocis]